MDMDIPSMTEPTVATPFQLLSLTEKMPSIDVDAASPSSITCVQTLTAVLPAEAVAVHPPLTVAQLTRMELMEVHPRDVDLNTVDYSPPQPAQSFPTGGAEPTFSGLSFSEAGHASVLPSLSECFRSATASLLREIECGDDLAIPGPSGASVCPAQPSSVGGFSLPPIMIDRPSSFHRSISSPLSTSAPAYFEDNVPSMSSSVSETVRVALTERKEENARKRKKLVLSTNVKFPEATLPAIRPRFQWYQAKGVIRVHLLIRNVLPTNFSFECNGRDLEFRVKADNCPYPPTRPQNPPRPLIDYHLPLRLTHRVYVEPEFSRISPSRVEIHFKKVKPFVEWAALWKIPSVGGEKPEKNPMDETSEEADSGEDSEEEENSPIRPSKRFVNGPSVPVGEPAGAPNVQSHGEPNGTRDVVVESPTVDQEMVPLMESLLAQVENQTKESTSVREGTFGVPVEPSMVPEPFKDCVEDSGGNNEVSRQVEINPYEFI
ncbi:hypothetical protein RvY_04075 [Ramazzottius varieornatus]|uniref:CS domain-containing protein n=1 Tax=Ramazzottius varieornatus TaxID=947166 RepID=A0A1D1V0D3_RAMVA|nr:hypothetical protein RvY_04075 [Ramazzottius varieornatus]